MFSRLPPPLRIPAVHAHLTIHSALEFQRRLQSCSVLGRRVAVARHVADAVQAVVRHGGAIEMADEPREIENGWTGVGIEITAELGVRRSGGKENRGQQQRKEARDTNERYGARVRYFTHGVDLVWLRERRTDFHE